MRRSDLLLHRLYGLISTWNWDGISPNPQHVGFGNYTQLSTTRCSGVPSGTRSSSSRSRSRSRPPSASPSPCSCTRGSLAVIYKVIIFIPVVLAPAIMAPVFRAMFSPGGQFNEVLHDLGLGLPGPAVDRAEVDGSAGPHGHHRLAVHRRSPSCSITPR